MKFFGEATEKRPAPGWGFCLIEPSPSFEEAELASLSHHECWVGGGHGEWIGHAAQLCVLTPAPRPTASLPPPSLLFNPHKQIMWDLEACNIHETPL